MLFLFILYVGIGAGLAITTLGLAGLRQGIDRVADQLGMCRLYARLVWLGGTIVAWPIGLFVLITGRLVLVDGETTAAAVRPSQSPSSSDVPLHHEPMISPSHRGHPPLVAVPPISSRNWSIER